MRGIVFRKHLTYRILKFFSTMKVFVILWLFNYTVHFKLLSFWLIHISTIFGLSLKPIPALSYIHTLVSFISSLCTNTQTSEDMPVGASNITEKYHKFYISSYLKLINFYYLILYSNILISLK